MVSCWPRQRVTEMPGLRARDGRRGGRDSEHRPGGRGQGGHAAHGGQDVGLPGKTTVRLVTLFRPYKCNRSMIIKM